MLTEPSITALMHRLGAENFRRRLRAEQALLRPLHRFAGSPRAHAAKVALGSPFIRLCIRLLGLRRRGYEQFLNPRVVEHIVRLPDLPPALDGVAILHLSDLHLDLDPAFVPALAKQLDGLPYDFTVITGDFRNLTAGPAEPAVAGTATLLRHLHAPVYAVPGNHDTLDMVPPLEAAGIRFLLNEHILWTRPGACLVVAGVDDATYYETHDLARAFAGAPPDAVRVLLTHSPAIYREAPAHRVNLLLAGHSHGGQICLPGGRMILTGASCPRRYLRGAWAYEGVQGYTSPGTGACGVPLRFHSPAEITRHVLRKQKA
ncbi:MAG: metallophosphoesterase [bacterium]